MLRQKNMIDDTQMSPNPDYIRTLRTSQNYHKCPPTVNVPQIEHVPDTKYLFEIEYVNVTEFIVYEGPPYTENVTEYIPWPLFVPVPVEVVRNVTQYEFVCVPSPIFVEMPITRNVTEYLTVEVEVVRNEYVTVEVEVERIVTVEVERIVTVEVERIVTVEVERIVTVEVERIVTQYVNNTDVCLRHLGVVFVETSTAHMNIIIAFGWAFVAAVTTFVWNSIKPLLVVAPNRWQREVFAPAFSWASATFFASVGGLGGVCITCWWEKFKQFAANLYASYAPLCYVGAVLFLCALIFALFKIINWGLEMRKQWEVDNQVQTLLPVLRMMVHSRRANKWIADRGVWETLKGNECRANRVVTAFHDYLDAARWSDKMEESMQVLVTFMESCDKLYHNNQMADPWFTIYWIKFSGCFALKKQIMMDTQVPCPTYNAFITLTAKLSRDSNVFADLQQKTEVEKQKAAEAANKAAEAAKLAAAAENKAAAPEAACNTTNGAATPAAQAGASTGPGAQV